ncbi:hypothetical protein [Aeromonas jandaei]|nr:hypothetical protein [Aeromonas jandaei]
MKQAAGVVARLFHQRNKQILWPAFFLQQSCLALTPATLAEG